MCGEHNNNNRGVAVIVFLTVEQLDAMWKKGTLVYDMVRNEWFDSNDVTYRIYVVK